MNNIPPFYIGQKVVYITGNVMPKNSIHVISNVWKQDCGCWRIEINNEAPRFQPLKGILFKCDYCGNSFHKETNRIGWDPQSFRPIQEAKFPLISYSKVLEEVEMGAN